jgi:MinD superfamily P-loop ATPase
MQTVLCPYCGADCSESADFVDIGVGEMQCGPYYCHNCGACEIGPHDVPVELSTDEIKTGWYGVDRAHLTSAPTVGGLPIDHVTARKLYEMGILHPPKRM